MTTGRINQVSIVPCRCLLLHFESRYQHIEKTKGFSYEYLGRLCLSRHARPRSLRFHDWRIFKVKSRPKPSPELLQQTSHFFSSTVLVFPFPTQNNQKALVNFCLFSIAIGGSSESQPFNSVR